MAPTPMDPLERTLLAHDGWLRQLVGGLVDRTEVDDVVQETFAAALRRPRDGMRGWTRWLETVARRLALRTRRTAERRSAREHAVARSEGDAEGAELVEQIEARQRVTRLVLGLDEPYRTTLLLRYYEDLTPGEIAVRRGLPVATVRTHLHRGLRQLRARIAGQFGRDWRAALAGDRASRDRPSAPRGRGRPRRSHTP